MAPIIASPQLSPVFLNGALFSLTKWSDALNILFVRKFEPSEIRRNLLDENVSFVWLHVGENKTLSTVTR